MSIGQVLSKNVYFMTVALVDKYAMKTKLSLFEYIYQLTSCLFQVQKFLRNACVNTYRQANVMTEYNSTSANAKLSSLSLALNCYKKNQLRISAVVIRRKRKRNLISRLSRKHVCTITFCVFVAVADYRIPFYLVFRMPNDNRKQMMEMLFIEKNNQSYAGLLKYYITL